MRSLHQGMIEPLILTKEFHNFRKLDPKSLNLFFAVLLKGVLYKQSAFTCVDASDSAVPHSCKPQICHQTKLDQNQTEASLEPKQYIPLHTKDPPNDPSGLKKTWICFRNLLPDLWLAAKAESCVSSSGIKHRSTYSWISPENQAVLQSQWAVSEQSLSTSTEIHAYSSTEASISWNNSTAIFSLRIQDLEACKR